MTKKIKLKVCGMRDMQNILQVAALEPDYMGFIFFDGSPRYIGADFEIPQDLLPSVKRVGVFVNAGTNKVLEAIERFGLDYAQLHGQESVAQCRELRKENVKVIKVFSIDDSTNFSLTAPYGDCVDFFLFDTKGKFHGGNARAFDWHLLEKYDQQVPFFLSGGLNVDNIAGVRKLMGMNLHAVDLNSGVEIQPALKDPDKIKAFKSALNTVY